MSYIVHIEDSIFSECQTRLRIWRNEHAMPARWLILGDTEYTRLRQECQVNGEVRAFQGVNVARFAVPTFIEIFG